jgi:hypothetical protein
VSVPVLRFRSFETSASLFGTGLILLDDRAHFRLDSYAERGNVSDFLSVTTRQFPNFAVDLSLLGNEDTYLR